MKKIESGKDLNKLDGVVYELYQLNALIPDTELRNMASSIDDGIGEMLFRSISENKSFDVIEMQEACKGNVIPASRNSFYRKRRRYISNIEQRLAATMASV